MYSLQVGKPYKGIRGPIKEGAQVEILPDTIIFAIFLNNPIPKEVYDFQKGKAHTKLYFEDNVLFFLLKLGDMYWVDAPYSKFLSKERPNRSNPSEGQGFGITLVLVDVLTQIIVGMRAITMTNIQSKQLVELLKDQQNISDYNEAIARIYKKYPLSEDIVRASVSKS